MDKLLHFGVCFVLSLLGGIWFNPFLVILIILCIGILKEFYDKYIKHTVFDWADFIADAWGAFGGAILILLIDMLKSSANELTPNI